MYGVGKRDIGSTSPRQSLHAHYSHGRHGIRSSRGRRALTVLIVVVFGLVLVAWRVGSLKPFFAESISKEEEEGQSESSSLLKVVNVPAVFEKSPTYHTAELSKASTAITRAGKSELNKGVRVRAVVVDEVVVGKRRAESSPNTSQPPFNEAGLRGLKVATDTFSHTEASQSEGVTNISEGDYSYGTNPDDSSIHATVIENVDEDTEEDGDLMAPLPNILIECEASASASHPFDSNHKRQCNSSRCRFCDNFPPHSSPDLATDLLPDTAAYLKDHVLIAVVTGSFGNFTRLDLALCTWLQLVPPDNLYLISDRHPEKATDEENTYQRKGHWVEGAVPQGHAFTKKQKQASEGYTIDWHKAQFRFMLGIDVLVRRAIGRAEGADGSGIKGLRWVSANEETKLKKESPLNGADGDEGDEGDEVNEAPLAYSLPPVIPKGLDATNEHIKWIAVVDDDTFLNLNALVTYFKRMDANEERAKRAAAAAQNSLIQKKGGTSDQPSSTVAHATPPPFQAIPMYIGDNGWGGAGHYFSRAAMYQLQEALYYRCIVPHMMKGTRASDETLKRCLPHLHMGGEKLSASLRKTTVSTPAPRMRIVNDRLFSHCQANFLRKRLLRGDHIASHIKRDLTGPLPLQALRARLYFQVIYMANTTCAYKLLMHFGACAYGSSCKLKHCDEAHDALAVSDFELLVSQGRLREM